MCFPDCAIIIKLFYFFLFYCFDIKKLQYFFSFQKKSFTPTTIHISLCFGIYLFFALKNESFSRQG